MSQTDHYNLPINLLRLVRYYPSTTRAAQALGINRQQLNKYINGSSMPSLATLQSIAAHFDLVPDDLLLPPEEFTVQWRPPVRVDGLPPHARNVFAAQVENMALTRGILAKFCGTYHVFTKLFANPDKIGRAYSVISQEGDLTMVKTVMFATSSGEHTESRQPVKVTGLAQWLGERIYICGTQNIGRPNARMRMITLYPPTLPEIPYLSGLLMTTNNTRMRSIYAAPIVFMRLPKGDQVRKADLQKCGVFDKDDPSIDLTVRSMLGNPSTLE